MRSSVWPRCAPSSAARASVKMRSIASNVATMLDQVAFVVAISLRRCSVEEQRPPEVLYLRGQLHDLVDGPGRDGVEQPPAQEVEAGQIRLVELVERQLVDVLEAVR